MRPIQASFSMDEQMLSLANIHWREPGGLVADRELIEKALTTLKTLKVYQDVEGFSLSSAKYDIILITIPLVSTSNHLLITYLVELIE
jgi:hypothetical protein